MIAEKEEFSAGENNEAEDVNPDEGAKDTFWGRHGATIGLVVLVLYVILLGIGTIAEIFEIDSILNWWIFRPPGR